MATALEILRSSFEKVIVISIGIQDGLLSTRNTVNERSFLDNGGSERDDSRLTQGGAALIRIEADGDDTFPGIF